MATAGPLHNYNDDSNVPSEDPDEPEIPNADPDESEIPQADPDAKVLCQKQEVFAKSHNEYSPKSLMFEKSLKTNNLQWCCWRTTVEDTIALGGITIEDKTPVITVLDADGKEAVYGLLKGRGSVLSGVAITDEKHLITVDDKYAYTVNITSNTPPGTKLHPIKELDVKEPIQVAARSKLEYGILCNNPRRIEFFSLKQVLMSNNAANSGFIKLDMPQPHICDTFCFTEDGIICVASAEEDSVTTYNDHGHKLEVVGKARVRKEKVEAGLLSSPYSIQSCNNVIIVSCHQGDVHTYDKGKWSLLMKQGNTDTGVFSSLFTNRIFCYTVVHGNRFWAIQCPNKKDTLKEKFKDLRKIHIYRF